jgi:hypothetical protein
LIDQIMTPIFRIAKTGLMAVALSACGGGGEPEPADQPGSVQASMLRGYVMDGPLVGAKVCLDINSNWVCDSDEPTATSSANGAFALDIAPLTHLEAMALQVIAEVGPDALDEATGITLQASGLSAYVLASQGGQRPILSPINTLRAAAHRPSFAYHPQLDTVNVADLLAEAGLSGTAEHYFDPAAPLTVTERQSAQSTGRVLASLLSSAQVKLFTEAASVYATDRALLGSRASELVIQVLRNTRPTTTNESESDILSRMQTATRLISVTTATEMLAHRTTSPLTAEDSIALLSDGLFDVSAVGSSPRAFMQIRSTGEGRFLRAQKLRYVGGQWQVDTPYAGAGSAGQHLIYEKKASDNSIEFVKISSSMPSVTIAGSLLKENFIEGSNSQAHELILLERSVSELPFNAISELESFNGNFPKGQRSFFLRRKSLGKEYLFDNLATFFTSLSQFKRSPQTCYEGICWSITQQPSGNSVDSAGKMSFKTTSSGGNLFLGEGRFIEETVAGLNVLRMISIPIEVQNRSLMWDAKDGRFLSFSDIDGKLWFGKFIPNGTIWHSSQLLNLTGLNAALSSIPAQSHHP